MPLQLVITLDDNQKLDVKGPIQNKLVVFGMLELAKEAIIKFHDQAEQRVQPAAPEDVAALIKPSN